MDVCDVKTDDEMEDESEGKDDDDVNNDESEGKDDDDEKKAESEGTDDDDDDDDNEKNADSEKKDDECVDVNKVESEKKIDDGQSKADDDVNDEQEVNLDSDDPIVPVVTEVLGPKVAEKDVDKDQNEEEYTSLHNGLTTTLMRSLIFVKLYLYLMHQQALHGYLFIILQQ
ncbi:uncharacterized protein [Rutidosis leptorrhynchoides]|uniref:uncharacterized protein n=1 Tax=Rutidosis leptorrhynchoides TaxID=125765 RepID=UPI003A98FEF0